MTIRSANNPQRLALENEVFIGLILTFALMAGGVSRYPASLSQGGVWSFIATAIAWVAYGGAAFWARRQTADSMRSALGQGARIGIFPGAIAILNHTVEIFANLDSSLSSILGVSMWGLMFLSFGVAGSITYRRTGSLQLALVSSVWAAIISTVGILLYGYLISYLCMPRMQQILLGAFGQSKMTDLPAFVIQNTMESGASHVLLAPVIAAIFGLAGGLASMILRSIHRGAAILLGAATILLFAAGLAAIRYASLLNRADRPPWIMFGLLSLGITLACAHPIFAAIDRREK